MTYESFTNLLKAVDTSLEKIAADLRFNGLPDMTLQKASAEIYAMRNILTTIDIIAKTEGVDRYYED